MSKLNEMWVALVAYQPQANAEGYGKTWTKMCEEKTAAAAADASAAAYAAAAAAADASASAAYSNAAADYAAVAGVNYAAAENWAQKAIDKINKMFVKQARQAPYMAVSNKRIKRTWVGLTDEDDLHWEDGGNLKDLVKAIEAKLKEKNDG